MLAQASIEFLKIKNKFLNCHRKKETPPSPLPIHIHIQREMYWFKNWPRSAGHRKLTLVHHVPWGTIQPTEKSLCEKIKWYHFVHHCDYLWPWWSHSEGLFWFNDTEIFFKYIIFFFIELQNYDFNSIFFLSF